MERIYLDISYLYFLFILLIMANCSTSKELFFFFFLSSAFNDLVTWNSSRKKNL